MKTSVKKLSDTRVKMTITLGPDELVAAQQVALKKIAKTLSVPGFRKGHVPLEVASKHANPNIVGEQLIDNALSKAVSEAFTKGEYQALERPEVEITKFEPGKLLEFTAETDVLPKITLGDYKKLKAEKTPVKVAKKEVDEVVERMAKGFATKTEVKKPAKDGDEVVIDFVGKKDDKPFDGGTAKDYALTLGSKSFIPGFEEALVGKKAGDKLDVPLTFPKDYHASELAGKKVVFEVTVHKVNQTKPAKINDEFAAKVGPFTDVAGMKADIEREIKARKQQEADDTLQDELVEQLVAKSKVAVPETLRKEQIASIEQDLTQNLTYQGMSIEQYFEGKGYKTRDEWIDKEVGDLADKRIKMGLVLGELSKELNITATSEELAERLNEYKTRYANNPDMAKRFDEPEVQREVANRLITEKTAAKLIEFNVK